MARTKKHTASVCGISAPTEKPDALNGSGPSYAAERWPAGKQDDKTRQEPGPGPVSRQNTPYHTGGEGESGSDLTLNTSPGPENGRHDRRISDPHPGESVRIPLPELEETEHFHQEEPAHGKGHSHSHGSGHGHTHSITSLNRAFILGITLNTLFVAAEFTAGFLSNSMGLISDAGHNLSDVASLILAMIAFKLAKVPASSKYTYGYRRSTILVSLLNAIILLIAVGVILAESIDKLFHPRPVEGGVIIWVAGIGVIINAATAWLFLKDKEKDLNVKGAYLHMAADALVSVGVVVSGIIIMGTGWYIIDPIIGILIALIIVYSTWGLLRDSIVLSLDGVPANIRTEEIEKAILNVPRVRSLHHLHIWAISTTETALTAHIIVSGTEDMETAKCTIKALLADRGIGHATLEMEGPDSRCADR